jgi:hypothetical protein
MHNPERFYHYDASFDPIALIRKYAVENLEATPGYLTNFLGVLIEPRFLPGILNGRDGTVEGLPIPANWHADISEWGAVLRAVELAKQSFTAVECGCGWGCWLNNSGVAARRRGLSVRLLGIEADDEYVGFANGSLATNGFAPQEFTIVRGISAGVPGTALFPKKKTGGTDWGRAPIMISESALAQRPSVPKTHVAIPCVPLDSLGEGCRIDLLHVDIQGGEVELIRQSMECLQRRVSYLVIGTPSRQIEGQLHELLNPKGFVLELDRPAILDLTTDSSAAVSVDGVQAWRNACLRHGAP